MIKILFEKEIISNNQIENSNFITHNGPYYDYETNIRAILHKYTYKKLEQKCTREEEIEILKLLNNSKYKGEFNFYFRESRRTDCENGLIGFAWFLEFINLISPENFNNELDKWTTNALNLCLEKTNKSGLISIIPGYNGIIEKTDYTLNHQLWFMYQAIKFCETRNLETQFLEYKKNFNKILSNIIIIPGFPIWHFYGHSILKTFLVILKMFLKGNLKDYYKKICGYHYFNLLPIKWAHENNYTENFKNYKKLNLNNLFLKSANNYSNIYGNKYNPVIIEYAIFNDLNIKNELSNLHIKEIKKNKDMYNDSLIRLYEIGYLKKNK